MDPVAEENKKAAALLHSVVIGHPLTDGNKRLGWTCAVTFLRLNGEELFYRDVHAAHRLVVCVAAGELHEVPDIASRLRALTSGGGSP